MSSFDPRRHDARSLLSSGRPTFTLKPQRGPALRVRMSSSRLLVGRGDECDLQLQDSQGLLSRRHCLLERRSEGVRVTDLSRNGCRVDGERIPESGRVLRSGQRLEFSGFTLLVGEPEIRGQDITTLSGASAHPLDLGLVGRSVSMSALRDRILRSASFPLPVLIHGETGTGKELAARALHEASHVARGPFVALNCGAIPEGTAASELFGHEKGAFTGASSSRLGAFRRAEGGTLFLDELAELSSGLQTSLLRVLEAREVLPLGAEKPVPVKFRLVAATHCDLRDAVARGQFREDLYYRVNVISLDLPPLRAREGDIALLTQHFASEALGGAGPHFSRPAQQALARCVWPGNVRQLRNVVLRALVSSRGAQVEVEDLDLRGAQGGARSLGDVSVATSSLPEIPSLRLCPARGRGRSGLSEIAAALRRSGGNRSQAAQELGISRSTLYARMARFTEQRDPSSLKAD